MTNTPGMPDRTTRQTPTRTRRLSTETKAAYKTTELIAYVATVLGVLLASALVGSGDSGADRDTDIFAADKAWLYITALTIGYLLSRGLAKAGSREPYDDDGSDGR